MFMCMCLILLNLCNVFDRDILESFTFHGRHTIIYCVLLGVDLISTLMWWITPLSLEVQSLLPYYYVCSLSLIFYLC